MKMVFNLHGILSILMKDYMQVYFIECHVTTYTYCLCLSMYIYLLINNSQNFNFNNKFYM